MSIIVKEDDLNRIKENTRTVKDEMDLNLNVEDSILKSELGIEKKSLHISIYDDINFQKASAIVDEILKLSEYPCPRDVYFYYGTSGEGKIVEELFC
ncbi:MAG: hypothetical protein U5K69_22915 [Balneolaceae bacterium]|nr:hypothetical protein [Balneolaceae bacterium]